MEKDELDAAVLAAIRSAPRTFAALAVNLCKGNRAEYQLEYALTRLRKRGLIRYNRTRRLWEAHRGE